MLASCPAELAYDIYVDMILGVMQMKERLDAVEDMLSGLLNQQTAGSSGNTKPSATASKSEEKAK